jgi:tRNA/tmRNA/rRNA uracil-C5-methylase (TrmA/RlmC/RlmD family)
VGLFSWFLAESGAQVTAVEGNPSAVRDAEHNLSELDVDIIRGDVAVNIRAHPARVVDTVVLDPSRQGAGTQLCTDIARLGATRVVYVACDPAALARDAAALVHAGYELIRVVPVDQFTHTGHIEAVATFHRF